MMAGSEILFAVETHATLILVGETGCGKSTQVAQYLDEAGWTAGSRRICCTQPRRVAAMSVASRVANEVGCELGSQVGYAVRFDHCSSSQTRIKFVTDGMLIRETMLDPLLTEYSVIMVDEAHERSMQTDILLGLLRKIRRKRKDLRIIISSATLEAKKFQKYFDTTDEEPVEGGEGHGVGPVVTPYGPLMHKPVILEVTGRTHPVDVLYANEPAQHYLRTAAETVAEIHTSEPKGDILLFLPGEEEIYAVCDLLQDSLDNTRMDAAIRPLHGSLPWKEQIRALEPLRRGRSGKPVRKIIVSTNIAETSVTIEGVMYVVDCGFCKMPVYNPLTGMESLVVQPISQASASQRAGRAGRDRPGKCFRLYSEADWEALRPSTVPEICRSNLAAPVLQLKALGIRDIAHFPYLDAPPAESMVRALELLYALGAIDKECQLTEVLGRQIAEFPTDPRVAAMLIASLKLECAEEALTIAAMVSVQNVFHSTRNKRQADKALSEFAVKEGDHLTLLNVYNEYILAGKNVKWCSEHFLNHKALRRASEVRRQLRAYLQRVVMETKSVTGVKPGIKSCGDDNVALRKCIVTGFFANAARLQPDGSYRTVKDDRVIQVHPSSVLYRFGVYPPWVIYHEVMLTTTEFMRDITAIEGAWLTALAPQFYEYGERDRTDAGTRFEDIGGMTQLVRQRAPVSARTVATGVDKRKRNQMNTIISEAGTAKGSGGIGNVLSSLSSQELDEVRAGKKAHRELF